jgi:hypothetical protein
MAAAFVALGQQGWSRCSLEAVGCCRFVMSRGNGNRTSSGGHRLDRDCAAFFESVQLSSHYKSLARCPFGVIFAIDLNATQSTTKERCSLGRESSGIKRLQNHT